LNKWAAAEANVITDVYVIFKCPLQFVIIFEALNGA
jgi:hypothetical protein